MSNPKNLYDSVPIDRVRNFCIVAHIDHGKSTLADCLIRHTGLVTEREMTNQILDNMDLERERGITIKAQTVRMTYKAKDGLTYVLNLIDTPGHVDFSYEVSRSLAACDGAILVVDASQGVEAQTLSNAYLAVDAGLEILPVINKIDLPAAHPEEVREEIEEIIGLDAEEAPLISAKNDINIEAVLEAVVTKLPPPKGDEKAPLQALIFDAKYDPYQGVIVSLNIKEGQFKRGDTLYLMNGKSQFEVVDLGYYAPGKLVPSDRLVAGDVGFFTAAIKTVAESRVGDTVTMKARPTDKALPGYKPAIPMVFCGLFPANGNDYGALKDALEKIQLNDAALSFEPETSVALGFGFRCGFLGLLHYEIINERIDQEFNIDTIATAPSVIYKVELTSGEVREISNPADFPPREKIAAIDEPIVKASIITPTDYIGDLMSLAQERRGVFIDMPYLDPKRVSLNYYLPLNEIIYDFFDAMKSRSRGYASLDYSFYTYQASDLVRLDILIQGEKVDALSFVVFRDHAYARARKMCEKLKANIPRQQFEIPIQASVEGKIIARETVRAFRKDVLAKCYGGDISRKKKLLEKQKEGKKRMRSVGSVEIPQEAFLSVLKLDDT